MNCKCCGFPHAGRYSLCPVCGACIEKAPLSLPAPKRKRTRLPYRILLGMFLLGLMLFFLIPLEAPNQVAVPENSSVPVAPLPEDPLPSEAKTLFQKDCFFLDSGTVYFDESKFIENPILIVPAAIDEQPVQIIGESCFAGLQGVTTIILPSSITAIEDSAFAGCTDLRGLCVPNRVEFIGSDAFRGCKSLEAVYIPTGLSSIGSGTFADCPMLTFIFYNGLYEEWSNIYHDIITPFTWVICWDGEYRHSAKTP